MVIKGHKSKVLVLALIAAMTVGCGGKEEREAKYLERGKEYLAEENYDKAKIEFKNVLQINPKSSEAHYYSAQVAEKLQEWPKAYAGYSKAIELDPENLDARAKLGVFNLLQANSAKLQDDAVNEGLAIESAKEQRDEIFKRNPDHKGGRLLEAGLLVREDQLDKAIGIVEAVLSGSPDDPVAVSMLVDFYLAKEDKSSARRVLEDGVEHNHADVNLKFRLAKFYANENLNEEAIKVIKDLIEQKPEVISYRVSLASYYAQLDRKTEAEEVLREAIRVEEDNPETYLVLADFLVKTKSADLAESELRAAIKKLPEEDSLYTGLAKIYLQSQQKDKALAILKEIIDRWSKDAPGVKARNILAQIYVQDGQVDKAKATLEQILAENPQDNDALLMRGKFNLQDQNFDAAIADFRGVLKDQPSNAEVFGLLAQAHMQKGDSRLARDNLQRAVEADPQNADARIKYARLLISQKEYELANKQIDSALKQDPANIPALIAQSDILAATNDEKGLTLAVDNLKVAAPDNPEGYFRAGRILRAKGESEAALAEYEKALALTQGVGEALMLSEIVDLELKMGRINEAESRVKQVLTANPEHMAANGLLGRVYLAQKDYPASQSAFEKQIAINPDAEQVWTELAFARSAQGDLAGAEKAYRDGLEKLPQNVRLTIGLAGLQERSGDYEGAMASYEQVLANQADNAIATNNLAALIADHKTDEASLARAKELADKLDVLPQPVFADTVGWVYYRLGDYSKAVEKLTKVVEAAPKAAIFHYHLGVALAKAGDKAGAKEHLKQAIDLGDFDGKQDAQEMLSSLN